MYIRALKQGVQAMEEEYWFQIKSIMIETSWEALLKQKGSKDI